MLYIYAAVLSKNLWILFLHAVVHMSPSPFRLSPVTLYTSRDSVSRKHLRWSQLSLRELPWLLHVVNIDTWGLGSNRRCLHPAHQNVSRVLTLLHKMILTHSPPQEVNLNCGRAERNCPDWIYFPPQISDWPFYPSVSCVLLSSVNLETLLGIIYPTRAWREQKPVVTVLVDLHYQYEVLHGSHEVATDVCL